MENGIILTNNNLKTLYPIGENMFLNLFKNASLKLAKKGGEKFLSSLQKFFEDSRLINEIHDMADKTLFLAAASSKEYRHIESIKEDNIYDKFIELCFNHQSLGVDIESFVYNNYANKTNSTQKYIIGFFTELSLIIFNVLKNNAKPDTKIILKGQELGFSQILSKLSFIESKLAENSNPPTTVVTYCSNMQNSRWEIKNYEPALKGKKIIQTISLTLTNSIFNQQHGDSFWELEKVSLIENFSKKVAPLLENGDSFSVLGLAPIPLLILYGNQFANRPNIDVYQLKKTPSTWAWEDCSQRLDIKTTWHSDKTKSKKAVIILSFSGKVELNNVNKVIDTTCFPTIELSIENPYDDFLRSKQQLNEFLVEYRKIKATLLELGVSEIHLFAAIPVSFAISIGQMFNPNYDASIITYDYKQNIYTKAITIGENK